MAGQGEERDRLVRRLRQIMIEAREAAGLNQTQLGKALGKSQSFVSNYERGQRRLDVTEFVLIARILGLDASAVFAELVQIGRSQ
jgi:transcriptional regulator with XRE-family HTH domain